MTVYKVDPLHDSRWPLFLEQHPEASIFHTPGWLEALRRTYGYEPIVYTTSSPGQDMTNGVVFCSVNSKLTGRRLVSVPFADHCQPLADNSADLRELLDTIEEERSSQQWKYVELRPLSPTLGLSPTKFAQSDTFYFHKLALHPSQNELFRSFHKSCVQRQIRRSERAELTYEEGRSPTLLSHFYRLLLLTRRKHQIPPQPISWFRNLIDCLGDSLTIRVAFKNGQPAASILTLFYNDCCVYKYGCSDARFNGAAATVQLFWRAITDAKARGAREFDMGRCAVDNKGLTTFKEHWSASRASLVYYRFPATLHNHVSVRRHTKLAQHIFANAPDWILTTLGKLLYKHVG